MRGDIFGDMNKCKNLLKRQRKYKSYFYCKTLRKEVILSCNKSCSDYEIKRNKSIKNKTIKQRQVEKSRFSIFTNNFNICYYCKKEVIDKEKLDLHEVYGGSNRLRSIKNGLVVPLCRICHSNEKIINYLRIKLQKEFEKTHTRDEFIQITGKSYIKGDD